MCTFSFGGNDATSLQERIAPTPGNNLSAPCSGEAVRQAVRPAVICFVALRVASTAAVNDVELPWIRSRSRSDPWTVDSDEGRDDDLGHLVDAATPRHVVTVRSEQGQLRLS